MATNAHAPVEEFSNASFSLRSMSCQRKGKWSLTPWDSDKQLLFWRGPAAIYPTRQKEAWGVNDSQCRETVKYGYEFAGEAQQQFTLPDRPIVLLRTSYQNMIPKTISLWIQESSSSKQ
jgi:hypothetical protein